MQPLLLRGRLISGLVLYAFALTHLCNHAVGLWGLYPLEQARLYFLGFWRSPLIYPLVPLALCLHISTVFLSIYQRHTFRGMLPSEIIQYALGFLAPLFLLAHVLGTRTLQFFYNVDDTYTFYLIHHWPVKIYLCGLFVMMVVVWGHGSLGIFQYIKTKKWYARLRFLFIALSWLLPLLAGLGVVVAANDLRGLSQRNPAFIEQVSQLNNPNQVDVPKLIVKYYFPGAALYLFLTVTHFIRRASKIRRTKHASLVTYHDGRRVHLPQGASLLEGSLLGGIKHAHFCGGRGRCTTCRVQILEGEEYLSEPSMLEVGRLDWIGAAADVRLACMTRVSTERGPVKIRPLV